MTERSHYKKKRLGSRSKPAWLVKPAWRNNKIRSGSYAPLYISIWVITVILLLAAFGSPQKLEDFVNKFSLLETPLKLLIQETAIVVVLFAVKQTWIWIRYGGGELTLDPFPGSIGGDVGGEVLLHIPYRKNITAEVELELVQDEVRREEDSYTTLWKEGGYAQVSPHSDGLALQFRFPVPANLPASDISNNKRRHPKYAYKWQLRVAVSVGNETVGDGFDIPVYPTAVHSTKITLDTRYYSPYSNDFIGVQKILPIEGNEEKFTVNIPMRGFSIWMAIKLVYGIQLASVGGMALLNIDKPGALIVAMLFLSPGLYLTGITLYHHLNNLRVAFDGNMIQSERSILGLPLLGRYSGYNGIQSIAHKPVRHGYIVYATTEHGNITLAEKVFTSWKAERVCNYFKKIVGI